MVKTALSVYLMFMALLVGLYFVAAPIIHGDTDEFPIWEVINYFMAVAVVIALAASFMHKRAMESPGRAVDVVLFLRIKHRLLQRPLASPSGSSGSGSKPSSVAAAPTSPGPGIDPLFAIVVGAVGRHIWQSTEDI